MNYTKAHPHKIVAEDFFIQDSELLSWVASADGDGFINDLIWDNLLIGIRKIRYDHRDVDLLVYFQHLLADLQEQLERDEKQWEFNVRRAGSILDQATYIKEHSFKFNPAFVMRVSTVKAP